MPELVIEVIFASKNDFSQLKFFKTKRNYLLFSFRAFRSVRTTIEETVTEGCNLGLLRYLLPLGHDARDVLTIAAKIIMNSVSELDLSICPNGVYD